MTKTNKIIYYILLVIITALFLFTSYDKLSGDPMAKAGFIMAHLSVGFMYFIGVCELLGAIGLWIRCLRIYAAAGLSIILLGAIVTTAIFISVPEALLPLVVLIVLWIAVRLGHARRQAGKKQTTATETVQTPQTPAA